MTHIYFRTDGNRSIATGHLMRCLTIARACADAGAQIKFIVSDEESLALLQERFVPAGEFDVYCLHRSYQDLPAELPALLSCLAEDACVLPGRSLEKPWFFLDSYYASPSYFQALCEYFRVAYLDDLRSFDCTVDLLINYDTEEDCPYYAHASCKLLGPQYTPLREQFYCPAYEVRPAARHVLLSTGGTDPYGVAEALLRKIFDNAEETSTSQSGGRPYPAQALSVLRSLHYHVLTSHANARYDALTSLAETFPSIHIHTNVVNVAALMASCDLAVSAGGTTLCELCAVGVPAVSFLMAENQRTAVETYSERNLIPCAGDIRPSILPEESPGPQTPDASTLRRILDFLTEIGQDYQARLTLSAAMRNFLDGSGAKQIAAFLTK